MPEKIQERLLKKKIRLFNLKFYNGKKRTTKTMSKLKKKFTIIADEKKNTYLNLPEKKEGSFFIKLEAIKNKMKQLK